MPLSWQRLVRRSRLPEVELCLALRYQMDFNLGQATGYEYARISMERDSMVWHRKACAQFLFGRSGIELNTERKSERQLGENCTPLSNAAG